MDLYIYSDESGVFDCKHEAYFVFGGLICFSEEEKNIESRKYIHVENTIRNNSSFSKGEELKACKLSNKKKYNIYRSLHNVYKFAVVVNQNRVLDKVFLTKKHRQRYLDFCYKIVLKKALLFLINQKRIKKQDIENIFIYCDQHTTATNGLYELREGLLNEFKYGTFNMEYDVFYDPILPSIKSLNVSYCNSKKVTLIRAADIIANYVYHTATKNYQNLRKEKGIFILEEPSRSTLCTGIDLLR